MMSYRLETALPIRADKNLEKAPMIEKAFFLT